MASRLSIVWRVKITLLGVEPEVSRILLVRPDTTLAEFHRYVQAAMGWQECHLYVFRIGGRDYGVPSDFDQKVFDARRYTLDRFIAQMPAGFEYVYDFGDHWTHRIDILAPEDAAYRKQYPICVDGAGDCPPEDCGGPPGYRNLRDALADSSHPQHGELHEWIKSIEYDRHFSVQSATWTMRDMQRGLR